MFNSQGQFEEISDDETGHNSYSLDGIMPGKRGGDLHVSKSDIKVDDKNTLLIPLNTKEIIKSDIERIGAEGGRAITVTFTDRFLNTFKDGFLKRSVEDTIEHTKGVQKYKFVGEYSETGRFHLHGVILCKDLKTLGNVRRKMSKFGICKIKVIDNSVGWSNYCVKSI